MKLINYKVKKQQNQICFNMHKKSYTHVHNKFKHGMGNKEKSNNLNDL